MLICTVLLILCIPNPFSYVCVFVCVCVCVCVCVHVYDELAKEKKNIPMHIFSCIVSLKVRLNLILQLINIYVN